MTNPRQTAETVRHILTALEAALRDGRRLPESYAAFCANCFASFLASSKAWRGSWLQLDAYEEFAVRSAKVSDLDRLLGTGTRLPDDRLRRIGHGFCASFGLGGHSVYRRQPFLRLSRYRRAHQGVSSKFADNLGPTLLPSEWSVWPRAAPQERFAGS